MRLADASAWPTIELVALRPSLLEADIEGIGEDAGMLFRRCLEATVHYRYPITRQTIFEKFQALVKEWKHDTVFMSSTTSMILHNAYQEIIGMGPRVIPLILRELEITPGHWFAALKALTGVDPVPPSERGRVKAMADAWLNWARDHGYVW